MTMTIKPYPYSSLKAGLEQVIREYEKDRKQKCVFLHDLKDWLGGVISRTEECPKCAGTGYIIGEKHAKDS